MKYIIDACAWIDYFDGNIRGIKIKKFIENENNEIVTNILNLSEISSFLFRKNLSNKIEEISKTIFSLSKIYNFDANFSKEAGILHAEIKKKLGDFGLVDAFVLLTSMKINAKIITSDKHFKNIKEAILIE